MFSNFYSIFGPLLKRCIPKFTLTEWMFQTFDIHSQTPIYFNRYFSLSPNFISAVSSRKCVGLACRTHEKKNCTIFWSMHLRAAKHLTESFRDGRRMLK
jgi:hypothetical protein